MMKKMLQSVGLFLLPAIVFYLAGSFMALSFNPAKWNELGRAMYTTMSILIGCATIAIFNTEN